MKTDFSVKMASQGHSVMHFKVTGKPIMDFMTPHNNIGFNSKGSEDVATEITTDHLTVVRGPSPRNPHEYPQGLYTA